MTKDRTILTVEYAQTNTGKVLSNEELRKVRMCLGGLAGYIHSATLVVEYMPDSDGADTFITLRNVRTT